MVFHVLKRGVGRQRLFHEDADYEAFERYLEETLKTCPMRIHTYILMILMPNLSNSTIET